MASDFILIVRQQCCVLDIFEKLIPTGKLAVPYTSYHRMREILGEQMHEGMTKESVVVETNKTGNPPGWHRTHYIIRETSTGRRLTDSEKRRAYLPSLRYYTETINEEITGSKSIMTRQNLSEVGWDIKIRWTWNRTYKQGQRDRVCLITRLTVRYMKT